MALGRSFTRDSNGAEPRQSPPPAPLRPAAPGTPLTTSVISNDLCILGTQVTIITKGALQVDGELQADLHGIEIVIGKNGRVEGTVVGQKVSIEGEVIGVVRGLDVELKDTAKVDGEIYHQTLAIAAGSYFEGKARRPKDTQELMPTLDRAAHDAKRTAA
jgi:cytoskeletal protein CcmA (bactofilin family)